MKIFDLLEGVVCDREKFGDLEIKNLTFSSKEKLKNSLYFCLKGEKVDGHNFAAEAVLNGAVCVVCERKLKLDVPQVLVTNSRKAFSKISANFYLDPAKKLKLIAITGTNGKTSTSYIVKSILEANGKKCGLIGTNGVFIGKRKIAENLTTPDPPFFQQYLKQMLDENCEFVVIEASAHAIYLNKLYGVKFECIALTNLTQDHLDFFGSMENYSNAKQSFFSHVYGKKFVVNIDDELGKKIVKTHLNNVITYGQGDLADFKINLIQSLPMLSKFFLNGFEKPFETNLIGKFNIYNCTCAICVCKSLGFDESEISNGLKEKIFIPGRFNVYENKKKKNHIVIDFAHTPDGIEKALICAREICKHKLICVFGCGGNRDKSKRKLMGAISSNLADYSIITSDNPRFENPNEIIKDITAGFSLKNNFEIEVKREKAIFKAISKSKEGDVVLIAGKGAESYQDILGEKKPFSDFECVSKFISKT